MTHPDDHHHLTSPRDGLPPLADTPEAVAEVAAALADGTGPVAVDTERASGFRFDDRAWLVQLRRTGAGTHLVDPAQVPQFGSLLVPVMNSTPWILHAAHTDLPALTTLGWRAVRLHDTQIAGRLLGYGQIGLAGMLTELLGVTVAKDKGREDWSARPLPRDMLTYAALDVELLTELLDAALSLLRSRGDAEGRDRIGWYDQECDRVLSDWSYPVSVGDWTRLRGIGAVRDPRGLELARRLTDIRTDVARRRDTPPERVVDSSTIIEMARSPYRAEDVLRQRRHGRGSPRFSGELRSRLLAGVREALAVDAASLPPRPVGRGGHPDHRTWATDFPVADHLLTGFRTAVDDLAADLGLHPSELMVSRSVRAVAWEVSLVLPVTGERKSATDLGSDPVGWAEDLLGHHLGREGARDWQIDLLVPVFLPTLAAEMPV
ncbi:HRDC domain-containing protein [Corynebacterium terpenotabidum]|uniref:Ribonuclease D n=1 Tax=Corynebacterium terpenotabidum Y-11 TaxID=1200352 RepID=S4XEA5_9CORY|nr:HRDC domain-containing protein [Corynebacterium terpenotabidum]AGP30894.1 ribonuclease D [Corynebacterium terpenotabidum Y-11]